MKAIRFVLFIAAIMLMSCSEQDKRVAIKSFPEPIVLQPSVVSFDTIPGVFGKAQAVDSSYLFFLYNSDHHLMVTDTDFNIKKFVAKKGEGPNEVLAIPAVYGDILDDDRPGILDRYAYKLYAMPDSGGSGRLELIQDFSKDLKDIDPRFALQLDSANYAIVQGINRYGIIGYNSTTSARHEWPLGEETLDNENPTTEISFCRDIDFNKKRQIVAEMYGILPVLILHNFDGSINKVISYGKIPAIDQINEDTNDPFGGIKLTDDYIYVLYCPEAGGSYETILVMGYDGNPVASLKIDPAMTFEIDEANGRIIAVNPMDEDSSVKYYTLPENLR